MSVFSKPKTREQHLAEISHAVTALGCSVVPPEMSYALLAPHLPKLEHAVPERYGMGAVGKVNEHKFAIVTGEYRERHGKGKVRVRDVVLAIVEHPNIQGTAGLYRDWKHSTAGAIIDKLLWIPPFTIIKMLQVALDKKMPDIVIGEPAFDSMFKVHSESLALAQQAVPPAARRYLVESNFDGTIVARPGVLIYKLEGARSDVESITAAIAAVRPLLEAFAASSSDHPMR
jgi:hypothetical protein